MVSVVVVVVIFVCAGWIVWRRQRRWRMPTEQLPLEGKSREALALEAFTHGNTYLAEGKFAEATAAFHQARDLDPKRAHVTTRLAEVERRQHAASATPSVNTPG
jgi:hypothetical protein